VLSGSVVRGRFRSGQTHGYASAELLPPPPPASLLHALSVYTSAPQSYSQWVVTAVGRSVARYSKPATVGGQEQAVKPSG
jgi:hypothetical protein